jgi:hypothetical protein
MRIRPLRQAWSVSQPALAAEGMPAEKPGVVQSFSGVGKQDVNPTGTVKMP